MNQESEHSRKTLDDPGDLESRLRLIVNKTPALLYSARRDAYIDFFNQHCLELLGLSFEEISGWAWTKRIHPDDNEGLLAKWRVALKPASLSSRSLGCVGQMALPVDAASLRIPRDERGISSGGLVPVSILTIKKTPKRLCGRADELRRSEFYLAEGQRLARIGSWSFTPDGMRDTGASR